MIPNDFRYYRLVITKLQNDTFQEYRPAAALEWFRTWESRNIGATPIAMSEQLLRFYANAYESVSGLKIPRVGRARIYEEAVLETIARAKQLTGRGTRTIRDAMEEALGEQYGEALPPLKKIIREELQLFKLELLAELKK